jgi:hypothetical protein
MIRRTTWIDKQAQSYISVSLGDDVEYADINLHDGNQVVNFYFSLHDKKCAKKTVRSLSRLLDVLEDLHSDAVNREHSLSDKRDPLDDE